MLGPLSTLFVKAAQTTFVSKHTVSVLKLHNAFVLEHQQQHMTPKKKKKIREKEAPACF
jgi:hypothetical protein